jgi:hypothetical protein
LECEERDTAPGGAPICEECQRLQANAMPPAGMLPAVLRDVLG